MKKERSIYIIIGVLFAVYIILIILAYANIERFAEINAAATNLSTVIVDAGHGGEDGGAVANNIVEKDINLSISQKLASLLRISGFNATETRTDDSMVNAEGNTLRERKVSDMKNRLELFNNSPDNTVISIHQNKFPQENCNGVQVFYSPNNSDSTVLAENIKNNIRMLLQPDNQRECKKADRSIYLLYNTTVPAIIAECGFLSNYEESRKLINDKYQQKIAFSIFTGYLNYYNTR